MSKQHSETRPPSVIPPVLYLTLTQLQLGRWFPDCEQDWKHFSSEALKALEYSSKSSTPPLDSQFIESIADVTRDLYRVKLAVGAGPMPLNSEEPGDRSVESVRERLRTRLVALDADIERVLAQTSTDDTIRESLEVISSSATTLVAGMLQTIQASQDSPKESN